MKNVRMMNSLVLFEKILTGICALQHVRFLISCIIVAGIVGALTESWRIIFIQALPAMAAL